MLDNLDRASNPPSPSSRPSDLPIRLLATLNLLLGGLAWSPWFEGTADRVGAADRIFGAIRLGGFRIDFVWFVLSSVFLSFAFFYFIFRFIFRAKQRRSALVSALFCLAAVLAFCLAIFRSLMTGVLDFG
jgi:hypothetical protein